MPKLTQNQRKKLRKSLHNTLFSILSVPSVDPNENLEPLGMVAFYLPLAILAAGLTIATFIFAIEILDLKNNA